MWIQSEQKGEKMDNKMLKIEQVSKEYRLGVIGQTTLRDEVARVGAKLFHKEDPTQIIGNERINEKGKFMALSDISLEVGAGEALGIIGHNGAGKSTLLKLITKIMLPTQGKIYLNGRVASMIEVGTGFHSELTGRENIYINGAILGMSGKEIDKKLEEIIAFSECGAFIDTPVKRYSSGMYLKLGFSVAAHLDAEIVIMDEVLSVGDVAFQNKCIRKMKEIAESGRTILYVSHHMNTVRSLCDRCIVLNQGKLDFSGDVESSIQHYISTNFYMEPVRFLKELPRTYQTLQMAHMDYIEILGRNTLTMGDMLLFRLNWRAYKQFSHLCLRVGTWSADGIAVAISFADIPDVKEGENQTIVRLDISHMVPGKYSLELLLIEVDENGQAVKQDVLKDAIAFEILIDATRKLYHAYNRDWGYMELSMEILS